MDTLTDSQEQFVTDLFINLAENNLTEAVENLIANKIWFNHQVCIKINDKNVNIAGTRFDEFKEENVNISFSYLLEKIKFSAQMYLFFSPDESIILNELIVKLENIIK